MAVLAAHAFHHAACEALGVSTASAVAAAIGEVPQGYSDCLRGHRGSLDRVHGWLVALEARGVHLVLHLRGGAVDVELE